MNEKIKLNIGEIIEKYDETGEVDECVNEIDSYMMPLQGIKRYEILCDTDVFDSCGLDIFYISVAWITNNDDLGIYGDRLTNQ